MSDRDPEDDRASAGDEMSSRLASRFEDDEDQSTKQSQTDMPSDPSKNEEEDRTSKTDMNSKPSQIDETDKTSVKDRPSVLMYLPEDLRQELDIKFDELNARYKREHGEPLEKNRDYYPAVIKAGLEGKDLKEVLNL